MNRQAKPSSAWSRPIRLSTAAWTETSSAEVGSSATSSDGPADSARARLTRWRWPPESSCG